MFCHPVVFSVKWGKISDHALGKTNAINPLIGNHVDKTVSVQDHSICRLYFVHNFLWNLCSYRVSQCKKIVHNDDRMTKCNHFWMTK